MANPNCAIAPISLTTVNLPPPSPKARRASPAIRAANLMTLIARVIPKINLPHYQPPQAKASKWNNGETAVEGVLVTCKRQTGKKARGAQSFCIAVDPDKAQLTVHRGLSREDLLVYDSHGITRSGGCPEHLIALVKSLTELLTKSREEVTADLSERVQQAWA